jgi:hypothetical protein
VQGEYRRSFGPLNFTGVRRGGPDDYRRRETAAPAAEEQRHRLTALVSVAALSLDALLSVASVPRRLRFRLANREPGHDG